MSHYTPPLQDMQFVLDELVDLHEIAALPGYGEATPDLARAVLEEAGVFASEVIAPLNHSGDIEGVRLEGVSPGCQRAGPRLMRASSRPVGQRCLRLKSRADRIFPACWPPPSKKCGTAAAWLSAC